jgi:hypothetical protein
MEEKSAAEWAEEIVRKHEHDQAEQGGRRVDAPCRALFDAIREKPVSTLIELGGGSEVASALNKWLEGRKGTPKPFGEE